MDGVVRTAAESRTVGVVGDVYRFLATGAETGGAYALWEALVPPGGGPPPHFHTREVEGFYVLEGEMAFWLGEKKHVAGPGMHVSIPLRTVHAFKNESAAPSRMLIMVAPAGLEEMFFEVGAPLPHHATEAPATTHDEIERLVAASAHYGVEIILPKS